MTQPVSSPTPSSSAGNIVVVGDYDADGATATTLVVEALRSMGADSVSYAVPNRFVDGYGLKPELVATLADRSPELLITVDNGVASIDGVAAAQALGARVVVTDHHLPGPELPTADAIVNPNLPDDQFESRNLAGVGVAFYVMSAVRAELREREVGSQAREQPTLAALLDLVAIGTVADVVPLDRVNRLLVQHGLALMRAGPRTAGCAGVARERRPTAPSRSVQPISALSSDRDSTPPAAWTTCRLGIETSARTQSASSPRSRHATRAPQPRTPAGGGLDGGGSTGGAGEHLIWAIQSSCLRPAWSSTTLPGTRA